MASRIRVLVVLAALPLLAACQGSWAQPTDVTLAPVAPSHVSGQAEVELAVSCLGRCAPTGGSTIILSSTGTTAAHTYSIVLAKGSCKNPDVAGMALAHADGLGFAQQGTSRVDVPLHQLLKAGYILVLHDLTTKRAVACGPIHSDAVW